jgi:hypothetical protein
MSSQLNGNTMKLLAEREVEHWCMERGMEVSSSGRVMFKDQSHRVMAVVRPPESPRRVALAYALLSLDCSAGDEADFKGCLLRITNMDIWSPALDRAGQRLLEAFLPNARSDAYLSWWFTPDEFVGAHALLTLPLLFEWDAYLVSGSAHLAVYISHDGPVEISTKMQPVLENTAERLEEWGWQVRERLYRPRP